MANEKKAWKSDELRDIEYGMQQNWEKHHIDYGIMDCSTNKKFFGTFPYPYMNGYLHLGHGFTMSAVDFACRYKRMMGYNVLQPFAFHLTGMPIVAAADKLTEDIKKIKNNNGSTDDTLDNVQACCQYDIMVKMGIPVEDIHKFTDPKYWGEFFSQAAKTTLNKFGYAYDTRRSFITTDANLYYDQFVKWQFNNLFCKGALKFGTRYDIFSVKDNQPCLGHERSSGEDAVPLKSYIIPFLLTGSNCSFSEPVYLIAVTQRPETIYGMTNIWIDDKENYEMFNVNKKCNGIESTEKWICKEYNLINLKYQTRVNISNDINNTNNSNNTVNGNSFQLVSYEKIADIKGNDITTISFKGFRAMNPFDDKEYPIIGLNYSHIDPSLKIDSNKGSGITISVPSESPVDYLGYLNADVNCTYKKSIKPIIKITHSDYSGCLMAPDLIDKVKQQKKGYEHFDHAIYTVPTKDMNTINDFCCTGSSTSATMICEPYKGMTIIEARNKIYNDNTDKTKLTYGKIIMYYEPDKMAISRSDDRLIVAKMDQWFIDYSDPQWKIKSHNHVDLMEFNEESLRKSLHIAVDWLEQWPCSRTYGLGTTFPEEIVGKNTKHMIDSLSDSTIYMAFYTIAHMFEELSIEPTELTKDVFDYIFLLKNYDNDLFIKYKPLRDEFLYWYPVDLRVSAKDLINNHLAMSIFTHVLIWDDDFIKRYKQYCLTSSNNMHKQNTAFGPQRYNINGYIMVQKPNTNKSTDKVTDKIKSNEIEKMSKSKGNFKTLDQAISTYSADAIRFTFASATTGTEDAYFDQDLCTRMIEKLHKEKTWILDVFNKLETDYYVRSNINLHDQIFMNEINLVIKETFKAYEKQDFRNVVTYGFHILQKLRDTYRDSVGEDINPNIIKIFIKTQLILMYPIIPHFCDYFNTYPLFKDVVYNVVSGIDAIVNSSQSDVLYSVNELCVDQDLRWMNKYLSDLGSDIMKKMAHLNKNKNKSKQIKSVSIYVATNVTDPFEKLAYEIYKHRVINTESHIMTSNEIIICAKQLDSEKIFDEKNGNNVNTIIRYYKHIEELVTEYGTDWLQKRLLNTTLEVDSIRENLNYYLKKKSSDNYVVDVQIYDPLVHRDKDKVSGVRINVPVIKINT